MGLSPIGIAVGLAVLAPNFLLLRFPPRTPLPVVDVPRLLRWLERAGQALCLVVPSITTPGPIGYCWAAPTLGCLGLYYALWGRYFRSGRSGAALYRPVGKIPVPMAVLPVLVFLTTAVWLGNAWIAVAAIVLAAGHLPAAAMTARAMGLSSGRWAGDRSE